MGRTNYTGYIGQTVSFEELRCSTIFTSEIHEHLIYVVAFNIFLSTTAFLGNTLILVALRRESSLHKPSKLLFRCLATTDLCVSLIAEPLNVAYWMSLVHEDWDLCRFSAVASFIVGYTLVSVSLLTLTAISVDRLLALLLGLRYRQVVTLKRAYVVVATFWLVSSVVAVSFLKSHLITFWYGRIVILLCLVTTNVSYTQIFLKLRRRRTDVQDHAHQQQSSQLVPLNMARYRQAVYSALWVQFAMVVCYLPYVVVIALLSYERVSSSYFLAWVISVTLVYFNSSLNPFLYCWKITEVRQAVKETIRQALCCLWSSVIVE